MYLMDMLVRNSGPIERFDLQPKFAANGNPKPIVLVGANGVGKTNLLGLLADALIEIAGLHYQDVRPIQGLGHAYFRVVGPRTQRLRAAFELAACHFRDGNDDFYYRSKAGTISPEAEAVQTEIARFQPVASWSQIGNDKAATGDEKRVEAVFRGGAYAFFPSTRFEMPYWLNSKRFDRDPDPDFELRFAENLKKPIYAQTALSTIKPWIIDVILDRSIDVGEVFRASDLNLLKTATAQQFGPLHQAYIGLNKIINAILDRSDARIVRINRAHAERRIAIVYGDEVAIPTLDHLSSGQSTLLAIFGTILRYGDMGGRFLAPNAMPGIIAIDEVDAHLHSNLQYDALPKLIREFPKIQFIVSSHSPLFVLGMQKLFGDDGFDLIEMPGGTAIDAERFREFETSFKYFRDTQRFEQEVAEKAKVATRPRMLTEGETDPKYLRTAAELLGFSQLATDVDFDWIGQKAEGGASGGGKSNLATALRFLRHNQTFVRSQTLLVFDCDAPKPPEDLGLLHVRTMPHNATNSMREEGVENLLAPSVFEQRFFSHKDIKNGGNRGSIDVLNKTALCDHLCDEKRDPSDFEKFRPLLEEVAAILLPKAAP